MAKVIDRGVMPRHLNKSQQTAITNFFLQFPPHEVAFEVPLRDEEASSYRSDIQQALAKAGWKLAAKDPYVYSDDVPDGLTTQFMRSPEHLKPDDPRDPKADLLFQMALGLAGVRLSGSGGGSGANITEDRLVIGIGKRRMDSYELTPSE